MAVVALHLKGNPIQPALAAASAKQQATIAGLDPVQTAAFVNERAANATADLIAKGVPITAPFTPMPVPSALHPDTVAHAAASVASSDAVSGAIDKVKALPTAAKVGLAALGALALVKAIKK